MKNKKRFVAYLLFALTIVSLISYLIYFRSTDEHYLFLSFVVTMFFVSTFLVVASIVDERLVKETNKLKEELNASKNLVKAMEDNNELVSKNLPLGILVYDDNYVVTYANDYSSIIFETNIFQMSLEKINGNLFNFIKNSKESFICEIYNKTYSASVKYDSHTIYLNDITQQVSSNNKYEFNKVSFMILNVDNINQSLSELSLAKRNEIVSKYYQAVSLWARRFNCYSFSSEATSNQLFIIKDGDLDRVIEDEFSVLDIVNEISKAEDLFITVSIGVGTGSNDFSQLGYFAEKALEIAHDRGGAQAVVYDGFETKSFGGDVYANDKMPKTQVKIFYKKFKELVENSSCVLIVPHIDTDADAIGSAVGLSELISKMGTPSKVLIDFDRVDSTTKKIIDASKTEYIKLLNSLIDKTKLKDYICDNMLVVYVDHHNNELSIEKDIYRHAKNIVVIDHHRITDKTNIRTNLDYIDHTASSSVELVMNLIDLSDLKLDLSPFISTLMLTGMMVDSSNFTTQVTQDTYKMAALLSMFGADSNKSKLFLREPVESQVERLKLIEKAEIILDEYAFLVYDDKVVTKEFLAKTADDLLNIENIKASFVLGYIDKVTVGVSSRSDQTYSVYKEMELLGGGGHFSKGAAQLKGRDLLSVKEEIVTNIKYRIKGESESMKVILIEDVKKQGKKGDIIECTPGYANFLLSKKYAVEANASNLAVLNEEKSNQSKLEKEELDVAIKTKELIEKANVEVFVKVGDNGRFFGSVNAKEISEALEKKGITVDKRKINIANDKIDALGTYKCFVKLHKEVTATLNFFVKASKEA